MKLSYQGIQDKQGYAAAQVALPQYDWAKMAEKTAEKPVWVHFGAGNIFRGFIAGLQQRLLNAGLADSGIVAAETFDYDIIDKIYVPHDSMTSWCRSKPTARRRRKSSRRLPRASRRTVPTKPSGSS